MTKENLQKFNTAKHIIINTLLLVLVVVAFGFCVVFASYTSNFALVNSVKTMNENFILYKQQDDFGKVTDKYFDSDLINNFYNKTGVVPQRMYQSYITAQLGTGTLSLPKIIESSSQDVYGLKLIAGNYPAKKEGLVFNEQILISDYFADIILSKGYKVSNSNGVETVMPKTYEDLFDTDNPMYCLVAQNQPLILQITGVYKTNYKDYIKYEDNLDVNSQDYKVYSYYKQYVYPVIYTSVGFTDRQTSTVKSYKANILTKGTNLVSTTNGGILSSKYTDDVYNYVKVFGFSNINFNEVKEGEIILPLSLFNEMFGKNIVSDDLNQATTATQAFDIIKAGCNSGYNFEKIYISLGAENSFDMGYTRFKVVGVSIAYSENIELNEKHFRLNTRDFAKFVKPLIYNSNILAVTTNNSADTLLKTIEYANSNKLTSITSSSDFIVGISNRIRPLGIVLSVVLMLIFGVLFCINMYNSNNKLLLAKFDNSDKDKTFIKCLKNSWWQNLIILIGGFALSILIGFVILLLLNVIINAVIGHALVGLYITKLSYLVMFNASLVVVVGTLITNLLMFIKPYNNKKQAQN